MGEHASFRCLVGRVRRGDAGAAAELVRAYEPEIRRIIRLNLADARLRRTLDSVDIFQSVMMNFFVRAGAGQFELERPEQLLKLLAAMARNKLRDHVARQRAGRRDVRRLEAGGAAALEGVPGSGETPSQVVAGRELLEKLRGLLTPEERYLAEQRADGREWADLAREKGEEPDALRKRLRRAVGRAARQLGLEEVASD